LRGAGQVGVDLAGDVALEAADDLTFAQSFGGASFDVVAGGLVVAHPDDGDDVQRAVRGTVAAAAEPVPASGATAAGGLRCDAAALGEGSLAVDPVGVVAGGDQELAGDLDADAVQFEQLGGSSAGKGLDLLVEALDLVVELLPASCQVA
jgi:hypothetical protein